MLVRFVILSFGFLFVHRMIKFQLNTKPLSEAHSKMIAKGQIIYLWLLTVLSPWMTPPFLIFFIFVPNLVTARLEWILNFILRHKFQQKLLGFVEELILLMMTGRSFRDAYLSLTRNSINFFEGKMYELLIVGHLQGRSGLPKYKEFVKITELIQAIDKSPHQAIDKLRAFRRQLHWKVTFQRKARQATAQIRAQAIILSTLYLGLLLFVVHDNDILPSTIISISTSLFLLGLIVLIFLGRQNKWKT